MKRVKSVGDDVVMLDNGQAVRISFFKASPRVGDVVVFGPTGWQTCQCDEAASIEADTLRRLQGEEDARVVARNAVVEAAKQAEEALKADSDNGRFVEAIFGHWDQACHTQEAGLVWRWTELGEQRRREIWKNV